MVALQGVEHDDLALRLGLVAEVEPPEPDDGIVGPPRLVVAPLEMRDVPLGVLREVDKVHGPGGNCIKIGLPGKLILRDYFQENRRPFLLLRISFPGRPILYNLSLSSSRTATLSSKSTRTLSLLSWMGSSCTTLSPLWVILIRMAFFSGGRRSRMTLPLRVTLRSYCLNISNNSSNSNL